MKAFFSKKRNIIIVCVSLLIVVFVVVGIVVSSLNNNNVESTTKPTETTTQSTTESATESTTESTTETTTTNTENTTKKVVENINVETTKKQTETTTKKKVENTNKTNSRSAKTKAEMLALTNLTVSDLHYYENIGLGEYVLWAFFPNMPKEFADTGKMPDGFAFVSNDKKLGWVKEEYYLYHGKLCYVDTTSEYKEILDHNTWTDEDFQQSVEDAKNYKCPYCNDHNCCSIEYIAMTNGVVYWVGSTDKKCPEVAAERAKCTDCGKILLEVGDERIPKQPDKYCDGWCLWGFGYNGEAG